MGTVVGPCLSVLLLPLLCDAKRCCPAASRRICPAIGASIGRIRLLVLLSRPKGLLSLREKVSKWMDEGCSIYCPTERGGGKLKMHMRSLCIFLVPMILSGCVTFPSGPSVRVMPGTGKTFEQFQADDGVCRQWAGRQIGLPPQEVANQNTAAGAVAGTLIGAGLGAAIGAAAGNPGIGAAIGAGSGLLVGTSAGASAGQLSGWEAQRRYDIAYEQCMYAKGNQIPVVMRKMRRTRRVSFPPPPPGFSSVPPDYIPPQSSGQ